MMTLRETEGLKVIDTLAFLRKYRFFVIAFMLWALIIIPWNITSLIMLSSNETQAGLDVFLVQCTMDTHLGDDRFSKNRGNYKEFTNSSLVVNR
jgi:hypothetical protein